MRLTARGFGDIARARKKGGLNFLYRILTGAEVETQIRDVMGQPKDVIERVKKLSE